MRTLLLAIVFIAACRSAESKREAVWLDDQALLADNNDDPEASAIVLFREQHLRFQVVGAAGSTSELHTHEAIKILSEAAFDRAAVRLAWPADSELLHLEGRTIAPDGTITPIDGAQLLASEYKVDDGDEKRDVSARFFHFPRVEVGSILEMSYTIVVDGLWTSWSEQISDTIPVREYKVEIVVDDIAVPEMLVLNHPARPTIKMGDDGFKHVTLAVKDVPAEAREPLAPSSEAAQPWWTYRTRRVNFPNNIWYTNEDWADATRSVKNLVVKGKGLEDTPALDTSGCKGNVGCIIERALAKTRELTVFVGFEDAFEHRKLADIVQDGTATSADKTLLLYGLLKKAGLEAFLVGVARTGTIKINPKFPSRQWLNHSIVLVRNGDQAFWIDPSCELCAAGTLPSWDPIGDDVLVLSADKGEISAAWWTLNAVPAALENVDGRTLTINLDKNGDAMIIIDERHTGEHALFHHARTRNDNEDDSRRAAVELIGEVSGAAKLLAHVPVECDRNKGVCTRVVKAQVPHMAHASKNGLLLPLDALRGLYDLDPPERKMDVSVTRASVQVDEIRIVPPAGMRIMNAPKATKAASGLVEIATTAQQDGETLVVKRMTKLRPGRVPRAEIQPMQDVLDVASSLASFVVRISGEEVALTP
jgi:hypothetical protein